MSDEEIRQEEEIRRHVEFFKKDRDPLFDLLILTMCVWGTSFPHNELEKAEQEERANE